MIRVGPRLRRRRAAGDRRLAAVEPHLRQQPQFQPGALQRRLASISTKASRCRARSQPPRATSRRSRRPSISTCRRASRRCCRICAPTRSCARTSSAGSRCCSTPAPACSSTSGTRCRSSASQTCGERVHLPLQPRLDRNRAAGDRAATGTIRGPATSACRAPGVELKLVPSDGKLEARLKGPNITPGYWRQPDLTAEAFDEEGFYKIGDALKFADPADPSQGLLFDGRLAEDFKLASGTWVSAGALRAQFVDHCAPLCARRGDRRRRPRRHRGAGVSRCRGLPQVRTACRRRGARARCSSDAKRARRIPPRLNALAKAEHRQLDPHLPR